MSCIFKITFPDQTYWLGFTKDYSYALSYHIGWFNRGSHPSRALREAFDKNGDYDFELLEEMPPGAPHRTLELRRDAHSGEGCLNRKRGRNTGTSEDKMEERKRKARARYHAKKKALGIVTRPYTRTKGI